jgi:hypothetical protein
VQFTLWLEFLSIRGRNESYHTTRKYYVDGEKKIAFFEIQQKSLRFLGLVGNDSQEVLDEFVVLEAGPNK